MLDVSPIDCAGSEGVGEVNQPASGVLHDELELRRVARLDYLFGTTDLAGAVFEIGPSHNPLAPKRLGYNTTIVDHADQAALKEKYADAGVDLDRIEPVDVVWSGQPVEELVQGRRFDWVIASHVAEHAPDLIGFLNDYSSLVAPGGRLGLILPDKRSCFDVARPSSPLSLGSLTPTSLAMFALPRVPSPNTSCMNVP